MRTPATIQQTKELVVALAAAYQQWHEMNKDGKRSWMEWVELVKVSAPAMWDGLSDLKSIPNELNDMDEAEADELIFAVAGALNEAVSMHLHRKVNKLLALFHAAVDAEAEWRGVNPPVPEIVSEP